MKPFIRPSHISSILKVIDSEYPDSMGISLKAYIADLENKQQPVPALTTPSNPYDSPIWSHKRAMTRQQHRQAHALRKLSQA